MFSSSAKPQADAFKNDADCNDYEDEPDQEQKQFPQGNNQDFFNNSNEMLDDNQNNRGKIKIENDLEEENEQILKQKFDDFFSSESDDIE